MSTQTTTRLATLPRVNLLPPEIEERKRLHRLQAGLALLVVIAAGGVAYLYQNGTSSVTEARSTLDTAQAKQTSLQSQIDKLADVTRVKNALDGRQAELKQATATRVDWSMTLSNISTFIPSSVWLTKLDISESLAPGSLADAGSAPEVIGAIRVEGWGRDHNAVAAWLDATTKQDPRLSGAYFSKSEEQIVPDTATKAVTFSSTVNVTSHALTQNKPGADDE